MEQLKYVVNWHLDERAHGRVKTIMGTSRKGGCAKVSHFGPVLSAHNHGAFYTGRHKDTRE
nr:hypothetical protein [Desulfobacterales bacterium]